MIPETTKANLEALLDLEPNWDSYGAATIAPKAVETATWLLEQILSDAAPEPLIGASADGSVGITWEWTEPQVVPTNEGGAQLEWHKSGTDLEIEVKPDGRVCVLWEADADMIAKRLFNFWR